ISCATSSPRSSPQGRCSRRHSSRYASVPISPARMAAESIASWKRGASSRAARARPSLAVTCAGMSRHQMTVSSGTGGLCDEALERRAEVAVAGSPTLVGEPEIGRGILGPAVESSVVGLREVHEPAVVAEHHRLELRVPVEPEAAHDERLEVTGEEVGQVEGRGLVLVHCVPGVVSGEEAVAVRAGQPLHVVLSQDDVERAAGSAVGIGDEDALVAAGELGELRVDRRRDPLGSRVELGREAADVDLRPPVELDDGEDLPCDRAAREDEDARLGARARVGDLVVEQRRRGRHDAATAARRASTRACAVSAATAASRQYASAPTALPNSSLSGAPPTRTMYLSRKPFEDSSSITTFMYGIVVV